MAEIVTAQQTTDPLIGTTVNQYRLTKLLGEGGQGAVYAANHVNIKREFAIKILVPRPLSCEPGDRERIRKAIRSRFIAEAHALVALEHPNIVGVSDAGHLPDGRAFMALELLDGDPLNTFYKKHKPLDIDTVFRILVQLCCGLMYAHFREVIHRDLKLPNLFITKTKSNPLHLKILDFGIAKISDPDIVDVEVATRTGHMLGTPSYQAPEQIRGAKNVDCRADIYSMAVVAYRLLIGHPPFVPEDPASRGNPGAYYYLVKEFEPPNIRTIRPDIPEGWAELFIRALSFNPTHRPPSARAFAAELTAAIPGGTEIVKHVAPLLADKKWLQETTRIARPKFDVTIASAITMREGGEPQAAQATLTYSEAEKEAPRLPPPESPPAMAARPKHPHHQWPPALRPVAPKPAPTTSGTAWKWPIIAAALVAVGILATLLLIQRKTTTTTSTPSAPTNGSPGATPSVQTNGSPGAPTNNKPSSTAPSAPTNESQTATRKPTLAVAPAIDAATPLPSPQREVSSTPDASTTALDASVPVPAIQSPTKKRGTLSILAYPWGRIYVNGKSKGASPKTIRLPEGKYRVILKGPAGQSRKFNIVIHGGKLKMIRHTWN